MSNDQGPEEGRRENRAHAPARARSVLLWSLLFVTGLLVTTLLDPLVYRIMVDTPWKRGAPWNEMFHSFGYMPLWLLVAAAMLLHDRRRLAGLSFRVYSRRAQLLFWPGLTAGVLAAVLKVTIRRERPWYTGGKYEFRTIFTHEGVFHGGGLGMPSSHMAVVAAASFVLWKLYPGAWPVWIFATVGCALNRLNEGAHFLSDVYVGASLGCLCGLLFWKAYRRRVRAREVAV